MCRHCLEQILTVNTMYCLQRSACLVTRYQQVFRTIHVQTLRVTGVIVVAAAVVIREHETV